MVKLKTTADKYRSDRIDYDRCMDAFGPTTSYCKGGRIIVSGFVCPHCGSCSPAEECESPKTT